MTENIVKDLSSNHKYRTEIPNILFELGLKPNELSVYLVIKRTAGSSGECFKSSTKIAKEAHVSKNNFIKIKRKLSEIHTKLKKALIVCTDRLSDCGDSETCLINVTDIWPENYEFFRLGGSANGVPPSANGVPGSANGVHKEAVVVCLKNNSKEQESDNVCYVNKKFDPRYSHSAAVFFACLKEVDIPDEEKAWLSKFGEERVRLAVQFVNSPGVKINKTILQTLKWHVKQKIPPEPPKAENSEHQAEAKKFNEALRELGYEDLFLRNEKLIPNNKIITLIRYATGGFGETKCSLNDDLRHLKTDFSKIIRDLKEIKK